jgi:hypothetical protein
MCGREDDQLYSYGMVWYGMAWYGMVWFGTGSIEAATGEAIAAAAPATTRDQQKVDGLALTEAGKVMPV